MTHALTRDIGFAVRAYEFELRSAGRNGRTLEGHVAVFNTRTRIPDHAGDFEEEMLPGFADRSLRDSGYPVMQFDHGKDPRVGTVPIGKYDTWEPDGKGYFVRGELFDNPVVEPVRQAIEHKAIRGMSFRFKVSKGGDQWERRNGGMDLRRVADADVPEAGPVVFPAYASTTVSVRSILATFTPEERAELIRELRAQAGLATDLNFAGRPSARSAGGGESDVEPREGDAPNPAQLARIRALRTLRNPVTLP
jgi:HK97 family phage prohead protease